MMNKSQQEIANSLPSEFIERVDNVLLSHAVSTYRKVAMLVGLAMMDDTVRVENLPDLFYRDRVKVLVSIGLLEAVGDLNKIGFSEVRLSSKEAG